ncbi:MAG: WxcM-like domain-containing protein [Alphaproteobacteria bacterium CG_4_10_14_0_8_um_filter_53_9]|nr:MAG: WxcM-like domain-containing protein [Alphaproteobacteria bacterium CG_4_10_14_0_8_um_filter_53_9]
MKPLATRLPLGTFEDARGHLTYAEQGQHLPFTPKRVYFMQNVPSNATRAGVAHTSLQQVIIAAKGSVTVTVKTPSQSEEHTLTTPGDALLIPPGTWRELSHFSPDALILALTSEGHNPAEGIKEWDTYTNWYQSQS